PRDIPAGPGEARDQPRADGIDRLRENDGNRRGRLFDGERGRCGGGDDHVEVESHERRYKFRKSLRRALRIPPLDDWALTLHVPELPEMLKEDVLDLQVRDRDEADPPDLACSLRLGGERLNEEDERKRRSERSAHAPHAATDVCRSTTAIFRQRSVVRNPIG